MGARAALLAGTAIVGVALIASHGVRAAGFAVTGGGVTNTDNILFGSGGTTNFTIIGANVDPNFTVTQTILNTQASFPFPPNLALPPILNFFRQQTFVGGVSASNPEGFTISGFGLGLLSATGSVGVTNAGSITTFLLA